MDFWTIWMEDEEVQGFIKCCQGMKEIKLIFISHSLGYLELKTFTNWRVNWGNRILLLSGPGHCGKWALEGKGFSKVVHTPQLDGLLSEIELQRYRKEYSKKRFPNLDRWAIIVTTRQCQSCNKPMISSGSELFGEDSICEECIYGNQ